MKIVFIETPSPWLVRKNAQVALGPLYLATILKNAGYDVRFSRPQNKIDFTDHHDADVICMSGTTLEYPMNVECAEWIRGHLPEKTIILGGSHATVMWQEIIKNDLFDAVCVGEGENVILDMIRDLENNCLKKVYFPDAQIENLDDIPFPNRELIEGPHGGDIFAYGENYYGDGHENIIGSRGCPYDCAFCAWKAVWNGKVRMRSPLNIKQEVEEIIDKYGIRQFRMSDDMLTWNKKKCLELCRLLKDLDIAWKSSVRADTLTPEISEAMAEAGCKEISPGIESGDQRVLDFLNKRTTTEKMKEGLQNACIMGIKIRLLLMIGTPGEHPDTPEINRDYLDEIPYDMITLSTFIPFPGSPIWDDPEAYYCTILNEDFRQYNKDYWISMNGTKAKREYEPLIHNKILTISQMKDNVERMEGYVEETGRYNQG